MAPRPRLSRAELEGYAEGLRVRLRAAGAPRPDVHELLRDADAALRNGKLAEADQLLRQADAAIGPRRTDVEVFQRPRGLVGYRSSTGPEGTVTLEEEPLANRMLIVGRLLAVQKSRGAEVGALVARLHRAEAAYRAGDRATAKRETDAVHEALERLDAGLASRSARNG